MQEQEFIQQLYERNQQTHIGFPGKKKAEAFIDKLFHLLFTPSHGCFNSIGETRSEYDAVKDFFIQLLDRVVAERGLRDSIAQHFFEELPHTYRKLLIDAEAILKSDPAARSLEEVLLAYPGFYATAVYRLSHTLYQLKVPLLPRLFSEYAHRQTGIDIHPGAQIGEAFAIDHGTGVVIGETTLIGRQVKLYQGVTLGALSVDKGYTDQKRHPTIEDNVIIYSGATILGGSTLVGHDSVIGGNVWLTYSVPAHSVVYHKSQVKVRENTTFSSEPINFVI